MLYKIRWHEAGNRLYDRGTIYREKIPLHIWVIDKLLQNHPHLGWWDTFWSRITPDYGDPFCFAYCYIWSNYYFKNIIRDYQVDVGYNKLSKEYREFYEKDKFIG